MGSANGEDAIDASGKAASPDRIILVVCPTHRDYRELPRISPPGIELHLPRLCQHQPRGSGQQSRPRQGPCRRPARRDRSDPRQGARAQACRRDHIRRLSRLGARRRRRAKARPSRPRSRRGPALPAQISGAGGASQARAAGRPVFRPDRCRRTKRALPDGLRFPLFVKPVKSFFSIGAARVNSAAELAALLPALGQSRSILPAARAHARALHRRNHRHQAAHRRGAAERRASHRRGLCAWRRGHHLRRGGLDHVPRHARLLALRLSVASCREACRRAWARSPRRRCKGSASTTASSISR